MTYNFTESSPEGGQTRLPNEILDSFQRVLGQPGEFWGSVRENRGYGPPLLFAAVMGLASGAVYTLLGLGLASVVAAPVGAVAGSFIGGAILYAVASVAGGRPDYEASVRIAAYTSAIMPLVALVSPVPLLGTLAGLYGLYLGALGVIEIEGADRRKTFIAFAALASILVLVEVVGVLTLVAVSRMVRG